jgi:AraC-like DNA-binding protein
LGGAGRAGRLRGSRAGEGCETSERHLRRYFLFKFQEPPHKWFDERRLARAAGLLLQGKFVKEAAAEAGFKSPAHFTRLFAHQYGAPPSAFRAAKDA